MEFNVTLIPGDGIGPEIVREARKVLDINKQERHIRGGLATKEKYLHEHNLHTSKNIWFFNNRDSHYISHKFICLYMVVFLYNSSSYLWYSFLTFLFTVNYNLFCGIFPHIYF